MKRLDAGVRAVFESGRRREYLQVMSRFHRYSTNNSLIIMMCQIRAIELVFEVHPCVDVLRKTSGLSPVRVE